MIRMTDFRFLDAHKNHVMSVLNGSQVSPGKKVMEFEEKFAESHKLNHAVMVNSGTDALRIALLALKEANGWEDGDKVLVPALTFVATINAVMQAGLEPVLVDVGSNDFALNAWRYLPSETRYVGQGKNEIHVNIPMPDRARALIVVHVGGQMASMDSIVQLCRKYKLKLIEDSCETMFAMYKSKICGTFGDISCFSTYAAHLLTTGAGGLACTQDDELASLMRSYANHGRNTDYLPPHHQTKNKKDFIKNRFRFDRIGYSCRSTELDAAVGCGELEVILENIERRRAVATLLNSMLGESCPLLQLPVSQLYRTHNYMFYPLVISEKAGFRKEKLVTYLESKDIETRDLLPILNQPCYKGRWKAEDYPTAKYLLDHAFYIPCHPLMTKDDVFYIAGVFENFFRSI